MTVQKTDALHTVCELERNQFLTLLAMYKTLNKRGNCSTLFYVEGSTAWLYNCPHFLPHLYNADQCFDLVHLYILKILLCT